GRWRVEGPVGAWAVVRVLGFRGLPPASRGLAVVRQRDAQRRPAVVRRGGENPPASRRRDPRGDSRPWPPCVAAFRGLDGGRHVELETGQGDARAPVERG